MKNLEIPIEQIKDFCDRWQITEFALFDSILRDDFRSDSDIDVLVTFKPNAASNLLDLVRRQQELEIIANRSVDLIEKRVIEQSSNWIRRKEILEFSQVIYSQPHDLVR